MFDNSLVSVKMTFLIGFVDDILNGSNFHRCLIDNILNQAKMLLNEEITYYDVNASYFHPIVDLVQYPNFLNKIDIDNIDYKEYVGLKEILYEIHGK